jgi:hypothetical protein
MQGDSVKSEKSRIAGFCRHQSLLWIAKGATLRAASGAIRPVADPGRDYLVPVAGIIPL